jgi:hypothetical protein
VSATAYLYPPMQPHLVVRQVQVCYTPALLQVIAQNIQTANIKSPSTALSSGTGSTATAVVFGATELVTGETETCEWSVSSKCRCQNGHISGTHVTIGHTVKVWHKGIGVVSRMVKHVFMCRSVLD